MHEESSTRRKVDDEVHDGAVPAYLLDRDQTTRAKVRFSCHWSREKIICLLSFSCLLISCYVFE